MSKETILVVEDEEDIQELLRYHLAREGYTVLSALSGEEALTLARGKSPALILLDLMLPGLDGLEVCRQLRADPATRLSAIIMVTAKTSEADVVAGLELGASDYILKPFSPRVLVARVRAVLRRQTQEPVPEDETVSVKELVICPPRHEVLVAGDPVVLTLTEFRILHLLARRPGWVFTRNQLINAVRGKDHAVTDRAVDVQIVGLRRKLGAAERYVETVRGVGYRFKE